MKRLIALGLLGLSLSGTASAQNESFVGVLLGPAGPVDGLVNTLMTQNLEPTTDGATGSNSGLLRGTAGGGLNDVLEGLLVNQDPDQVQRGLVDTIIMQGVAGEEGVLDQLLGFNNPGDGFAFFTDIFGNFAPDGFDFPGIPGGTGGGMSPIPGIDGLGLPLDALDPAILQQLLAAGGGAGGLPSLPGL